PATDGDDALRAGGAALVEVGAVDERYVEAMLEREWSVSTFVGAGVAIPHGPLAGKDHVRRDALSFVSFPAGVDWNGERVYLGIGIAARDNGHVAILAQLAEILLDGDRAAALRAAGTVDEVLTLLSPPAADEETPV